MANTYELTEIHIVVAQSGGVNTARISGRIKDLVTGVYSGLTKDIQSPPAPAQARIDSIVTDAFSYLASQYPGATFTVPQS